MGPKRDRPTALDEKRAYTIATGRDELLCQMCLRWCGAPQLDHRQNRQSGNTVPSNLQTLGLNCHQWKTEHPREALHDGWAVPRWADPAEWPAKRWIRTELGTVRAAWVLYDDDGGWDEISAGEARRRMGQEVTT